MKSKLPSVSILNVKEFTSKEDFIERVKKQNPQIKEKLDQGGEFSIVFTKKPQEAQNPRNNNNKPSIQIVARVSDDIRQVIKMSGDKLYMDLVAHRVVDRFYIKRCNKCQQFGHYEKDCTNKILKGFVFFCAEVG